MENVRFFYSNKEVLTSFRNEVIERDDVEKLKKNIQINFCLDYSFKSLKTISLEYFNLCVGRVVKSKREETFDYCDLLDSIFYLFVTDCDLKKNEVRNVFELLKAHITLNQQSKIEIEEELLNHSKTYISIIIQHILNEKIDNQIINKNHELLGFDEFSALFNGNHEMLYDSVEMDLRSINRMRNLYKEKSPAKPIGFQDFSNMFATLGKIEFWKRLNINLDQNRINQLFVNEFGKNLNYFSF
ncbi:hypothetical protein ACFFLS_05615 [Flavobacterium procerum]|uniref:Uncharacterized protein n=1 Tax=Flavobacterium procerum TaxID=1455569 RepID=A0ABV6BM35_9FLAO